MGTKHRMTPIMGWASWNCFHTEVTEEKLKKQKGESLSAVEIDIIALYERRMRRREMSMEERNKDVFPEVHLKNNPGHS